MYDIFALVLVTFVVITLMKKNDIGYLLRRDISVFYGLFAATQSCFHISLLCDSWKYLLCSLLGP